MAELTRRYVVMAMAAAAPFDLLDQDAPFVLKPWKDPAALIALKSYRDHCYPELAQDLDEWIRLLDTGPLVLGGVGRRNEAHLASTRRVAEPLRRRKTRGSSRPRKRRPSAARRSAKPTKRPR